MTENKKAAAEKAAAEKAAAEEEKMVEVEYLGPGSFVVVAPYGHHYKDMVKEYPKGFAEELVATSKKQDFQIVKGGK